MRLRFLFYGVINILVSFPLTIFLFFLLLRATGGNYTISYIISTAFLLAVLLLPLWIYLEQAILRPIGRIIEADRHVISGDEEKRFIPEKDIPKEEIGQIMRSRERMIHHLDSLKRRYHVTVSSLPFGLVVLDKDMRILLTNHSCEKLLGVSGILGRGIKEVLPLEGLEEKISRAIEKDEVLELPEVTYHHPERGERVLSIMLSGIFHAEEEEEEEEELTILIEDVTEKVRLDRERRLLQEELIQAEKLSALGTMISGIAHELNNQLTPIIGFSQLLLQRSDLDERVRDTLVKILGGGERASRVVGGLLRFARRYRSERAQIDINGLIEETLELVAYNFKTNGIEVLRDLSRDLPKAMANANEIQQVFLNIINNARDAMVEWGGERRLRIKSERDGGRIRVIFSDTGPGIPAEYRDRVFEPFFTTKPVGKGTGLGLSVSYGIVEAHGGRIYLGDCEGGATFVVELPLVDLSEGVGRRKEEGTANGFQEVGIKGSVLVIDDEEVIVDLIEDILSYEGLRVDKAYSGRVGLEKLSKSHYDFIICDINMPDLSGMDLYNKVIESYPQMANRFIFLTGDIVNSNTYAFLENEKKPYISKPFTVEKFLNALRPFLNL
jgi:signal transduction histidine kinase